MRGGQRCGVGRSVDCEGVTESISTAISDDELRRGIERHNIWYHRFEVRPGIVVPGIQDSPAMLAKLPIPARCDGMRVLDVGALNGYYSFALEQRGADVLAVDSLRPDVNGFELLRAALGSRVAHRLGNVYELSVQEHGTFDLVLCLGLIYHLRHPLLALDRIWNVTKPGGKLVLETQRIGPLVGDSGQFVDLRLDGEDLEHVRLAQFHPAGELVGDETNWWVPNEACLRGLVEAACFDVEEVSEGLSPQRLLLGARRSSDPDRIKRRDWDASDDVWPYAKSIWGSTDERGEHDELSQPRARELPRPRATRRLHMRRPAEFERVRQQWDALGEQDPLWAILTLPGKRGGGWDLDEFLATGRPEVEEVLDVLAARDISVERDRALDFGCGIGRLTHALAQHFSSCDGVDVAGSMIEQARELNPAPERVRFHHNEAPDLRLFADRSFDFVLSLIVLQHMEPSLMRTYLKEFVRVLGDRGVAYFNVPERCVTAEELPAVAYRASVTLLGEIPTLAPSQITEIKLKVRNDSAVPWPATAQVRVGNHWLSADGEVIVSDDGRSTIEHALSAGSELEMDLEIVAPSFSGEYQLEVDLVQEQITWFAGRGSIPLRVPTAVIGAGREPMPRSDAAQVRTEPAVTQAAAPVMEMHVMSREEVTAAVLEAGGVVLAVNPRDRCGSVFPSLDYVIARADQSGRIRLRGRARSLIGLRREAVRQ